MDAMKVFVKKWKRTEDPDTNNNAILNTGVFFSFFFSWQI